MMGIEFIISNNTIVLGQRKEQSRTLSCPRGRPGEAGGRGALLGAAPRRSPGGRSWLRLPLERGTRTPAPATAGRVAPPAEAARGAGGAALSFDLFFVAPFAAIPQGRPLRLGVYSFPSWPPAAKQFLASGARQPEKRLCATGRERRSPKSPAAPPSPGAPAGSHFTWKPLLISRALRRPWP